MNASANSCRCGIDILPALIGQKITIWKQNDCGFGTAIKATLTNVTTRAYAQYKNVTFLQFRITRKRTENRYMIKPDTSIVIWAGWYDVNTEIWGTATTTRDVTNVTTTMGRASAFSGFWKQQALDSVKAEPVFIH